MDTKVLVVDDDMPIHFLLKNLLKDDFTVLNAHNVREAKEALTEHQISLILSDIHMPEITGLEFLESLRKQERYNQIPFLIMTNLPTVEKEQKAFDLGAEDFIKKDLLINNKDKVLHIIRTKIETNSNFSSTD
ncbi:MAG: response regulator [Balneolaceae bacterium]